MKRTQILALVALLAMASAQAHRQPTPATTPVTDGKAQPDAVAEASRKAEAENVARDKAWDAKLRKTMGGVCRGC